jgi:hypothetical protein
VCLSSPARGAGIAALAHARHVGDNSRRLVGLEDADSRVMYRSGSRVDGDRSHRSARTVLRSTVASTIVPSYVPVITFYPDPAVSYDTLTGICFGRASSLRAGR